MWIWFICFVCLPLYYPFEERDMYVYLFITTLRRRMFLDWSIRSCSVFGHHSDHGEYLMPGLLRYLLSRCPVCVLPSIAMPRVCHADLMPSGCLGCHGCLFDDLRLCRLRVRCFNGVLRRVDASSFFWVCKFRDVLVTVHVTYCLGTACVMSWLWIHATRMMRMTCFSGTACHHLVLVFT